MKKTLIDTIAPLGIMSSAYGVAGADLNPEGVANIVTILGQAIIAIFGAIFAVKQVFKK